MLSTNGISSRSAPATPCNDLRALYGHSGIHSNGSWSMGPFANGVAALNGPACTSEGRCGKTVLMAYLQHHLNINTAFFFACREPGFSCRSVRMILSLLLRQILEPQPLLFQDVLPLGRINQAWIYEQLLASFQSIVASQSNKGAICFIDGWIRRV